jgi:hypothetical protein
MKTGRLALSLCLSLLGACPSTAPAREERVFEDAQGRWTQRTNVHAFYSGHSLSDGVPEAVAAIAASLQHELDYEFQSLVGSTLRERTKGFDPDARGFNGYRRGRNRRGTSLDVGAELRGEHADAHYDVLVVTERHDLPWSAYHESTAEFLEHIVEQLVTGNASAEPFLYHSWLELDLAAPDAWLRYERDARRLWECVASKANRELTRRQRRVRVRVLPGATALAQLVEDVVAERVPGMVGGKSQQRLRLLFRDDVHLAPAGNYFMGLVHYGVLFGQSAEGAAAPAEVPAAAVQHLQRLAWEHVREYAKVAEASASRSMSACREFAAYAMCPAFSALRGARDARLLARFFSMRDAKRCQDQYLDANDPHNPFR